MPSKRLKEISGKLDQDSFASLLKQIEGKAILVVLTINKNCQECMQLIEFVNQLDSGWIQKIPQLVLLYGYSMKKVATDDDSRKEPTPEEPELIEEQDDEVESGGTATVNASLSDSNHLDWEGIPDGHGYAVFQSAEDISYFTGFFSHDEFKQNILDAIRRFKTSIKTLAGLPAKREFLEKRGSGIIIETTSLTKPSQVSELEQKVDSYKDKLKTAVYFCKGLSQEMSYVRAGQVLVKVKGLDFDKLAKKISKL